MPFSSRNQLRPKRILHSVFGRHLILKVLGGRLVVADWLDRLWIITTWDSLGGQAEAVMERSKDTTRSRRRRLHQPL